MSTEYHQSPLKFIKVDFVSCVIILKKLILCSVGFPGFYLPNVEADRIHDSWLDYFLPREHSPRHCDGLGGVTVCVVMCSSFVDDVVVDPWVVG